MCARTGSLTAQFGDAAEYRPRIVAAGASDRQRRPVAALVRQGSADDMAWPLGHRPQAARLARAITAAVLRRWHVESDTTEAALLVVSEMVTNAIEHAKPPLALHLIRDRSRRQLRVEVVDGGPSPRTGEWTASCAVDEHGRGMAIIDAVTIAHGIHTHADGVTHWANLPSAA